RGRTAAGSIVSGWLTAAGAAVVLAQIVPGERVVAALAAANTLGMSLAGVLLVLGVRRDAGPTALRGVGRTLARGVPRGAAGAGAGWLAAPAVPEGSLAGIVAGGVLAAAAAAAVVLAAAWLVDRDGVRRVLRR